MTILTEKVPEELAGKRFDQIIAMLFPEYSRSRLQAWIKEGKVLVNDTPMKPKERLEGGEVIQLDAEPEVVINCLPENIHLDIVFEDDDLLVVNKPAGMVVHPAAGNWNGTLQNALLHHQPALAQLPRAGIVHRIDKLTSGLLVVAKSLTAHNHLVEQLQNREIHREYLAVSQGRMTAGGCIDAPIGRHPVDRKRNAVRENGRMAVTHYRVIERYRRHTLIQVRLETGRTHQIRVHMESIHYPLVGDPMYGGRFRLPPDCSPRLENVLRQFKRQALHAQRLVLQHPVSAEQLQWEAATPKDMTDLIAALQENEAALAGG